MSINTIKEMCVNELNLPHHIVNNIMFEQGGIEHPAATGMKEYWNYMRTEQDAFTEMINYGRNGKWVTEHRESPHPMFHFPILFKTFILE
jgi:hypothetical protein|tara:strand:- start:2297 stop:2566 length:270 start_codon:yes stop_codon:yes gene_type:complete